MTDADFAKQKARIQALIEKWHTPLGLLWWTVTHEYCRSAEEMPKEAKDTRAYCTVRWPYLKAWVYWNLDDLKDVDDDELERNFVHECLHILCNEMRDDKDNLDHEERVCTTLANAFLWVRESLKQ